MYSDSMGVIFSIGFVILVIVFSETLRKKSYITSEATRKIIHIGVSHWWLIAMATIEHKEFAIIPPLIFVGVNYYSYKKDLIKSMERSQKSSDLGTVFFPISLILLVLLTWDKTLLGENLRYIGGIGVLVMGYGDGFAAIIGKKFGNSHYGIMGNQKSVEGSLGMLFFSFLACLLLLSYYHDDIQTGIMISLVVAMTATLIEALTPFGLDNITVPTTVSLLAYFLIAYAEIEWLQVIFRGSIGLLISLGIALVAYRKKSLTVSGSIGAVLLGTIIYTTSGMLGASLLVFFFISSSLLSHYKKTLKRDVQEQFDKTGNRDIFQVLANGGMGMIGSILFFITKNPKLLLLVALSFSAANADTWATELGVLNTKNPISLKSLKRVNKGTSGAISLMGTLAAFLGAGFIGLVTIMGFYFSNVEIPGLGYLNSLLIITLGGFLGALIDSFLGATLQGVYYSDETGWETEKRVLQGRPNKLKRGFVFLNNDLVNFLSISISSLILLGIVS